MTRRADRESSEGASASGSASSPCLGTKSSASIVPLSIGTFCHFTRTRSTRTHGADTGPERSTHAIESPCPSPLSICEGSRPIRLTRATHSIAGSSGEAGFSLQPSGRSVLARSGPGVKWRWRHRPAPKVRLAEIWPPCPHNPGPSYVLNSFVPHSRCSLCPRHSRHATICRGCIFRPLSALLRGRSGRRSR